MAVDQQLLNRSGGQNSSGSREDAMASRLMQDKKKAKVAAGDNSAKESQFDFSQFGSFSQLSFGGGSKKNSSSKPNVSAGKDDPSSAASVLAKLRRETSELLKWAWENAIETYGATLLYVPVHAMARLVFPSMFCKLGHEWIPEEMQKVAPDQAAMAGDKIGVPEKGACGLIVGILGLSIIFQVTIWVLVMGLLYSILGEVYTFFSDIWSAAGG